MMRKRTDVLVVGGGLVGVCCAHALASRGARVTLIERDSEPGPPASASYANCGLVLPIEPAKGYSVDVVRPAAFPEVPLYLGESRVVLTPLGDSLRLGGTLELSG